MVEHVGIEREYLDPVLHVPVINDLQDFLLLDGQFVGLRRLETRKHKHLLFVEVELSRSDGAERGLSPRMTSKYLVETRV